MLLIIDLELKTCPLLKNGRRFKYIYYKQKSYIRNINNTNCLIASLKLWMLLETYAYYGQNLISKSLSYFRNFMIKAFKVLKLISFTVKGCYII